MKKIPSYKGNSMEKYILSLGFYDEKGYFFPVWDIRFPNDTQFSVEGAGTPERYVLRINGYDILQSKAEYRKLLKKAREGAFNHLLP